MKNSRASRFEQRHSADHICAELSYFNVIMAATYFRRAARANYPDVVREIGRDGVSVVLVEQNVTQALALAARAYVVTEGHTVMSGTAEQIRGSDDVRRQFLGEV